MGEKLDLNQRGNPVAGLRESGKVKTQGKIMTEKFAIEWENQKQGECDTLAQGLRAIADAEDAGEILGHWAGVRALDGSGIVADVHLPAGTIRRQKPKL